MSAPLIFLYSFHLFSTISVAQKHHILHRKKTNNCTIYSQSVSPSHSVSSENVRLTTIGVLGLQELVSWVGLILYIFSFLAAPLKSWIHMQVVIYMRHFHMSDTQDV